MMMAPSFILLHVLQRPARPLQPHRPTLRFWCLTPKGRGFEYVDLGGASYLVLAYYIHLESYLCDTLLRLCIHVLLSCILLYLCDSDIYVIVIYDMCALYFTLFICHITCVMLICLCFRVYTLMQMSFVTSTHA